MELNHFSHEHPLMLQEEHNEGEGDKVSCNGCLQPIITTAPTYSCTQCVFFLHKVCAGLPSKMLHPLHPKHGLTLLAKPPPSYGLQDCFCRICGVGDWKGFTYNCAVCQFDIDIICALKSQTILDHTRHEHTLMPIHKPAMFLCHGCGTKHEGVSYQCRLCKFWINQKCASLPSTITRNDHHEHPLNLLCSYSAKDYIYKAYCDICNERVMRGYWAYYCAKCLYLVHVKCATSKTAPIRDQKNSVEHPDSKRIVLPMPDGLTIDFISHFVKKRNLKEKNKAAELNHFSHHHPLVLSEKQNTNESCSESELPINQMNNNIDQRCKACLLSISAPFYRCDQCNFSLHQSCAKLPNVILDSFHHEHPLALLPKPASFDLFQCNGCHKFCNGFFFQCPECHFFLDVHCASLPHVIRHEAHKHILMLEKTSKDRCNACHESFPGFIYNCVLCNFNLHPLCAQFPRRITHRYDMHPFSLTYFPVPGQDEYICEFCEQDINPKAWFYHCVDCDQSAHAICICHADNEHSNIKVGDNVVLEKHPHLLTRVGEAKEIISDCKLCGGDVYNLSFQCEPCLFRCQTIWHSCKA